VNRKGDSRPETIPRAIGKIGATSRIYLMCEPHSRDRLLNFTFDAYAAA
jgi:hypothetical protein